MWKLQASPGPGRGSSAIFPVQCLSVYICSGSISQGCLYYRKAQRLALHFRVKICQKSTAKKLKIDAVLIHQQPLWVLY